MAFTAEIRDSITLGIGPGSDIPTFLTLGLKNVIERGPYSVAAVQLYQPGAAHTQLHTPGPQR